MFGHLKSKLLTRYHDLACRLTVIISDTDLLLPRRRRLTTIRLRMGYRKILFHLWVPDVRMGYSEFKKRKICQLSNAPLPPGDLFYCYDMTLSQSIQPMAAQLSLKAALPLVGGVTTASNRCSKTWPSTQWYDNVVYDPVITESNSFPKCDGRGSKFPVL